MSRREDRVVVLVPSELDKADEPYWANFVWHVKQALANARIEARIEVVSAEKPEKR